MRLFSLRDFLQRVGNDAISPHFRPQYTATMNAVQCFLIEPPQEGQTLLAVLRTRMPGSSWNDCRRVITSRRVMVNGVLCIHEARRLKHGDEVRITATENRPAATAGKLHLYFTDEHLVVVEKPPGIVCTRRPEELHWSTVKKALNPTLDELVLDRLRTPLPKRAHFKPNTAGLLRVQRLDRETSGVMVFARTQAAADGLIEQFAGHQAERKYLALVHGKAASGTTRSQLVRDRGDGRRGSSPDGSHGVPAITHVRFLEARGAVSQVECQLETGRTHQIRIHLSEQGHPVCGDSQYGCEDAAPRLCLHARDLAFLHPLTQQRMEFHSPWPPDLATWWDRLR